MAVVASLPGRPASRKFCASPQFSETRPLI
jgi:hypothetical protein